MISSSGSGPSLWWRSRRNSLWLTGPYLDVSKNRGTPKSSILIGFSIINHPFWGTPIFETPMLLDGQNRFKLCLFVQCVVPIFQQDGFKTRCTGQHPQRLLPASAGNYFEWDRRPGFHKVEANKMCGSIIRRCGNTAVFSVNIELDANCMLMPNFHKNIIIPPNFSVLNVRRLKPFKPQEAQQNAGRFRWSMSSMPLCCYC